MVVPDQLRIVECQLSYEFLVLVLEGVHQWESSPLIILVRGDLVVQIEFDQLAVVTFHRRMEDFFQVELHVEAIVVFGAEELLELL